MKTRRAGLFVALGALIAAVSGVRCTSDLFCEKSTFGKYCTNAADPQEYWEVMSREACHIAHEHGLRLSFYITGYSGGDTGYGDDESNDFEGFTFTPAAFYADSESDCVEEVEDFWDASCIQSIVVNAPVEVWTEREGVFDEYDAAAGVDCLKALQATESSTAEWPPPDCEEVFEEIYLLAEDDMDPCDDDTGYDYDTGYYDGGDGGDGGDDTGYKRR